MTRTRLFLAGSAAALGLGMLAAAPAAAQQVVCELTPPADSTGGATATGAVSAFACGPNATASGAYSSAIGHGATASGNDSVALGTQATASGGFSTAAGRFSLASGQYASAFGDYARATGPDATALGTNSLATDFATAVGFSARATAESATAVGIYSRATAVDTTALGWYSLASAARGTALGWYAYATGVDSTAARFQQLEYCDDRAQLAAIGEVRSKCWAVLTANRVLPRNQWPLSREPLRRRLNPSLRASGIQSSIPVVCLLLMSFGTPANAQVGSSTPAPDLARATYIQNTDADFRKMDADRNGRLSRTEIEDFQRAAYMAAAQAKNRATFNELDADRNGQLSPVEFAAVIPPFHPNVLPIMGQVDKDRDGQITAVEYRAAKVAQYDKLDTDTNGVLSAAELRAGGLIR